MHEAAASPVCICADFPHQMHSDYQSPAEHSLLQAAAELLASLSTVLLWLQVELPTLLQSSAERNHRVPLGSRAMQWRQGITNSVRMTMVQIVGLYIYA